MKLKMKRSVIFPTLTNIRHCAQISRPKLAIHSRQPLRIRSKSLRIRPKSFHQVSKEVISNKVSKQELEDFKKIFSSDKESLKRHLETRGFKPARVRSILNKVFGNIKQDTKSPALPSTKLIPEIIKAAKNVLKDLPTDTLLQLYYTSNKDTRTFKNRLISLGYPLEEVNKRKE